MFNWYSAPTFLGMLLLWVMACYVATRGRRTPLAVTTVAAQVAGAAYLLGQGMLANAATVAEWRAWADKLQWGATLAPVLWYWVTVLLLRDQGDPAGQRYLRRLGYPLGLVLTLAGVLVTVGIYLEGWLYRWDTPVALAPEQATYFRYRAPQGPLYPAFIVLTAGAMLAAAINTLLGWRWHGAAPDRRRFAWLFLSAVLFALGTAPTAVANWLGVANWPTWLGHVAVAVAVALLATNVAAYNLVLRGQAVWADLLYFLTATGTICLVYALALVAAGPTYSFSVLSALVAVLVLAVLTHALVEPGRRVLDRLFFGREVSRLRSNLAAISQDAAFTQDLGALLNQAQSDLAAISEDHFVRLTEEALRRLNSPAALARCGLQTLIPLTLAAAAPEDATPLAQARLLRETLANATERLKPSDGDSRLDAPSAVQYHILREEYLLGLPNKQIMLRHNISEGTFHRNRRQAVAALAGELREQEELLAREQAGRA